MGLILCDVRRSDFVRILNCIFLKMANMKRGGEYDNGMGGPKRSRAYTDKFEMRILVPSKMAGSVIGKGGQNIQKIRSDFQAQVRIPDCPGPERVMSVVASDPDIVTSVLQNAIPYMYEQGEGADDGGERELRLLIHQSIVGGIIGKSGQKIKEIRENSGSNVKVYSNCAPQSSDRCVQVTGSLDKVVLALQQIFEIREEGEETLVAALGHHWACGCALFSDSVWSLID